MWMFDLIWQAWYRCHHNTYPSSHHVQKPTAKHTNCPATLNVTVKTVADRCRWVRQCVYIIVYSRRDWRQIHLKSYHTLLLVRSCTKYGHVNAKPKSRIYSSLDCVHLSLLAIPHCHDHWSIFNYLPDNLPDKASPGETGSASRVTQTEIVYKVTHLYNVFPIAAW